MANLKDTAKAYVAKQYNTCIECGDKINDRRSLRCRRCYKIQFAILSNFAKGFKGENNGMWKGDKASYFAIHDWIRKYKPKPKYCEICNIKEPKQVANLSGEYKRDINDYQWLCIKCHVVKDGTINNLFYNRNRKEVEQQCQIQ